MRSHEDLVDGWIRKAESDLAAARVCIEREVALDAACFHAQQAAEKYLKAYLTAFELPFPFIHDLGRLAELCAQHDPEFRALATIGAQLTPYAVVLRYDDGFWPSLAEARDAYASAIAVRTFVRDRLPPGLQASAEGRDA